MLSFIRTTPTILVIVLVLSFAWESVGAQSSFSSGSTGADGAFAPTIDTTIMVPLSGVFNYTTVNVPNTVTVTYVANAQNTTLTILATGNVTISGLISLNGYAGNNSGGGGQGGPGGSRGGAAGYGVDNFGGTSGDGPGGGGGGSSTNGINLGGGGGGGFALTGTPGNAQTGGTGGQGGAHYGSSTALPLMGGSGGGGGGSLAGQHGGAGGGGAGAILIASSTSITVNGRILATGGPGFSGGNNPSGGGGSGGLIRLVANTVNGPATLGVVGGPGGSSTNNLSGGAGAPGYIRVEAYNYTALIPDISPPGAISYSLPNPVTVPGSPSLRIASVAGSPAPPTPLGSLAGVPDIVLPSTQSNPVTVAIEATNVPLGTTVEITVIPANGIRTSAQSSPLAGTVSASSATASVTLPSSIAVLAARAVVDVSIVGLQPRFIEGEQVKAIEVAAAFGGQSEVFYITASGRRIKKD